MSYREIPKDRILKFPATPGFKGWKQFFTPDSTAHPAKMNLNLLRWIIETYTEPGEVILDPMAGTGSTIILASLLGRHGVAVEYEPRFCDMIRENIRLTERQATLTPKGRMTCIQGDARELSKLLGELDAVITSPPYSESRRHDKRASDPEEVDKKARKLEEAGWGNHHTPGRLSSLARHFSGYSTGPDNIGNLPHGDIDTVVTSPPFGPSTKGGGIFREGYMRIEDGKIISDPDLPFRHGRPLSDDPRNIDNLPYGESVDSIVTSPPYENTTMVESEKSIINRNLARGRKIKDIKKWSHLQPYSQEPEDFDNIGNLKSESYLEAMLQCYREMWKVLKPAGRLIVIVKNFIRDKAVVRLDLDTIRLCEAAGFTLRDRWYFKQPTRSFWRILYKKRFPNAPDIDYEDVMIFSKEEWFDGASSGQALGGTEMVQGEEAPTNFKKKLGKDKISPA